MHMTVAVAVNAATFVDIAYSMYSSWCLAQSVTTLTAKQLCSLRCTNVTSTTVTAVVAAFIGMHGLK
jgi:hypothetical protein